MSSFDQGRKCFNEIVLKEQDPSFKDLVFQSSVCDVYEFDVNVDSWVQKNVKGPLFLYSTHGGKSPYTVRVLNRMAPSDFVLDIVPTAYSLHHNTEPLVVEMQDATIMVQTSDAVVGLWLFEESDRAVLFNKLKQCQAVDTNLYH